MGRKHVVIFSHGFGVRSDSRGMFTDIVAALPPDSEKVMFDYDQWDGTARTLTVVTMDERVRKLQAVIAETRAENPNATIDLICHSQGCIVAGLVRPTGLRRVILLGPLAELTPERMKEVFTLPNTHIDFDGTSTLQRRDGSTTIVPKEYWESVRGLDPIALYNALADVAKVVAIHADQDEVIGSLDFSRLSPKVRQFHIDADHNFKDTAREPLVDGVLAELAQIPIVNEQDEIIGYKFRDDVTQQDIYRVSALWVKNSRGEVLLAQRNLDEPHDPGKWQGAVAGTVEKGETYLSSIMKEMREEIGLEGVEVTKGPKLRLRETWNYFCQWFITVVDKPAKAFAINKDEIAQVRWIARAELERELREHPERFTNGGKWPLKEL